MEIPYGEPGAVALVNAIQQGDLDVIDTMLAEEGLAQARIRDGQGATRTLLHVVTDWPGYFPNGPEVVRLLIAAGADPSAAVTGMWHTETPLHWAASSDDSDVAVALIEGGADVEIAGGSIAGGTALDDAVGYGCWHVARLLVERGAKVDALWKAAGLGMIGRVKQLMAAEPPPTQEEIDHSFWQACHGGQRRMAEYLLTCGADINAIPDHTTSTPLDAAPGPDTRREAVTNWLREHGAQTAEELSVG
ncbi:MAG: ankyrin repeat domain-containing protein [Acidimicrobiales bacterium]